jgi:cytochrome c556
MRYKWQQFTQDEHSRKPSSGRSLLIAILMITVLGLFGLAMMPSKVTRSSDTEPLIMVMRGLMQDMQQVDRGIWYEQFGVIDSAASKIANHPKALVKERKAIAKTLGDQMSQFVEYDMVVHHHADSIAMAAQQKDMQEVVRHYQIVQTGCVNCHSDFRSTLRDTLRKLRSNQ